MKKLFFAFIASLLVLTGCADLSTASSSQSVSNEKSSSIKKPKKVLNVKLVKIIDGDTIQVVYNGKKESVRLLLVDTPETVHPTKPVEPFGPEASAYTKNFFKNAKTVDLEFDVGQRDKYQRLLAYVWNGNKMINEELLKNGLARVAYIYEPNTKYVDQFKSIQEDARKSELGIWSIENYATDKGFNENSSNSSKPAQSDSNSIPDANGDGKCNDIKGNIGSNGKIYHVPGGASYEATKAEQYFCSIQEAEKAGFRKAKR